MKLAHIRLIISPLLLLYLTFRFHSFMWSQENIFPVYMKLNHRILILNCIKFALVPLALSQILSIFIPLLQNPGLSRIFNEISSTITANSIVFITNLISPSHLLSADKILMLTSIFVLFLMIFIVLVIVGRYFEIVELENFALLVVIANSSVFFYLNLKSLQIIS